MKGLTLLPILAFLATLVNLSQGATIQKRGAIEENIQGVANSPSNAYPYFLGFPPPYYSGAYSGAPAPAYPGSYGYGGNINADDITQAVQNGILNLGLSNAILSNIKAENFANGLYAEDILSNILLQILSQGA